MTRNLIVNSIVVLSLLCWVFSVVVGFAYLMKYENTSGPVEDHQFDCADQREDRFDTERFHIVMLAHPRCPCTRASLDQLRKLLESYPEAIADVFFWQPSDASKDWQQTDLWRSALAIPRVRVYPDEKGTEAQRLGGLTSGHVVVFARDGTRLFSGGITDARGRFGESHGATIVEKILSGEISSQVNASPVFGCPLFDSRSSCVEGDKLCPK